MSFLKAFLSQESLMFSMFLIVYSQEIEAETLEYLYTIEGGGDFKGSCCMAHGFFPHPCIMVKRPTMLLFALVCSICVQQYLLLLSWVALYS